MAKRNIAALAAKATGATPAPAPALPEPAAQAPQAPALDTAPPAPQAPALPEPTQASAPILGPLLQPIERTFAPAPASTGLSAGQRAAITRASNRASGQTGAAKATASKAAPATPRAAGVVLELLIESAPSELCLSFRAFGPDGQATRRGLGDGERALLDLRWYGRASDPGELFGFDESAVSFLRAGADRLESVLPLMRRLDRLVSVARAESEDVSLAFVASILAGHARVDRIKAKAPDGTETEHKRGAAYVTAHRASEAFLATVPKLEPLAVAA